MENESKILKHEGTITSISDGKISVNIESHSACSSCHAKGACTMSDKAVKIIEVDAKGHSDMIVGDRVEVLISQNIGNRAAIVAYILPLVILVVVIISLTLVGVSEHLVALLSLASVALYYFVIYFLRDKINKKIKIDIRK